MGARRANGGRGRNLWVLWSLLPFGLGSWAPIVPGVRSRVRSWSAVGVFWLAVEVVAIGLAGSKRPVTQHVGGALMLIAWAGGFVSSLVIRVRKRRGVLPQSVEDVGAPAVGPPAVGLPALGAPAIGVPAIGAPAPVGVPPTSHTKARRARRAWWPWVSLLPAGLGSWIPLFAAVRCRVWSWALVGVLGIATTAGGFVLVVTAYSPYGVDRAQSAVGGMLLIVAWVGGIAASFEIRPSYERRRGGPVRPPTPWPQPTPASREWSVRYALGALVLAVGADVLLGLLLVGVLNISGITVGVAVLIFDAMLLGALVPLARKRGLSPADLGLRPTIATRSLGLVVLALVAYIAFAEIWVLGVIGVSTRTGAGQLTQISHPGTLAKIVAVVAIAISAPVVEEIFFRGLLYRSLRNRLPVYQAALIAGVLFGLVHLLGYPPNTIPIKAAFGVIACLLYERTGSLLPGIALHSFVDATAIDLALTGNNNIVLTVAGSTVLVLLLRAAVIRLTRGPQPPALPVGLAGDSSNL